MRALKIASAYYRFSEELIFSVSGSVRSVTKEQLKNYKVTNRRYRNRRIGDFLKELHLTEGRNTGFKKILDALKFFYKNERIDWNNL